MKYPDFLFTKPLPQRHSAPHINCLFGILEIKASDEATENIEKCKALVSEAMEQTYDYVNHITSAVFALPEPSSQIVASYIVYGKYYTKVTLFDDT